ncbi:MAG: sulfatase activating formylglycine-generating enzyme [Myxococcota bacterium]|jgi:formylglycine-generating enzyme required for sulfatase activity
MRVMTRTAATWTMFTLALASPTGCSSGTDVIGAVVPDSNGSALDVVTMPPDVHVDAPVQAECNAELCASDDPCKLVECVQGGCVLRDLSGCCTSDTGCDDFDSCTQDRCEENRCVHRSPAGGCCKSTLDCRDDDICTTDACVDGLCRHEPRDGCCHNDSECSASGPCLEASCSSNHTCLWMAVTIPCDDGDPCSLGDVCHNGACLGTAVTCSDCELCHDGGCLPAPGWCRIDDVCRPDGTSLISIPCLVCDADSQPTDWSVQDHGFLCNDEDPCTYYDQCVEGECSGTATWCTSCETCDGAGGCVLAADFCLIDDQCVAELTLSPVEHCLACQPSSSSVAWTALGASPCDDGDPCTHSDTCSDGACDGTATDCSGSTTQCTVGACEAGACVAVPVGGGCDDGTVCTTADQCTAGQCLGNPVSCPEDAVQCTDAACDAVAGCIQLPNTGGECTDGESCTLNDKCQNGACPPNAPLCDDGDPCTADSCVGGDSCVHVHFCCGEIGSMCQYGFECEDGNCAKDGEVLVPAGDFWRGCDPGPECPDAGSWPAHRVILSDFALDRFEVTVDEYKACVQADACTQPGGQTPAIVADLGNYWYSVRGDHPVNYVSQPQGATYCAWVSKRLPTSAEWEKAVARGCAAIDGDCRTGRHRYPWGNEEPQCGDMGKPSCGPSVTQPVGSFPKDRSVYGSYDLAGNVREHVADFAHQDFYCRGPQSTCAGCVDCPIAECCDFSECQLCDGVPAYADPWVDPVDTVPAGTTELRGGGFNALNPGSAVDRAVWKLAADSFEFGVGTGFRCARSLVD